jgi:hypothetical protein
MSPAAPAGYQAPVRRRHFQWSGDPDETFGWMIRFIDHGLRAIPAPATGRDARAM